MLNFSIAYGKTPVGLARDWKVFKQLFTDDPFECNRKHPPAGSFCVQNGWWFQLSGNASNCFGKERQRSRSLVLSTFGGSSQGSRRDIFNNLITEICCNVNWNSQATIFIPRFLWRKLRKQSTYGIKKGRKFWNGKKSASRKHMKSIVYTHCLDGPAVFLHWRMLVTPKGLI